MKPRWRRKHRLLLVRDGAFWMFITLFVLLGAAIAWLGWAKGPLLIDNDFRVLVVRIKAGLLVGAALAYGVRRVAMHPAQNLPYWSWLATTPWRRGLPLPLGPAQLAWQDAIVACGLMTLAFTMDGGPAALPVLVLLAVYVIFNLPALGNSGQRAAGTVVVALLPVPFYFLGQWWVMLGIVAGIAVIHQAAMWRSWTTFPWKLHEQQERALRRADPRRKQQIEGEEVRIDVGQQASLGWPFNKLNGHVPRPPSPWSDVFTTAPILGWYLFTLLVCIGDPTARMPALSVMIIIITGVIFAVARCLVYSFGRAGPLPLLARLFLFQPIVPGYDYAFLAPLTILCASLAGVVVLAMLTPVERPGLTPPTVASVTFALLIVLVWRLPPSLRHWNLTGQFRILAPARRAGS